MIVLGLGVLLFLTSRKIYHAVNQATEKSERARRFKETKRT